MTLASQIEVDPRTSGKLLQGEKLLDQPRAKEAAVLFRDAHAILDT